MLPILRRLKHLDIPSKKGIGRGGGEEKNRTKKETLYLITANDYKEPITSKLIRTMTSYYKRKTDTQFQEGKGEHNHEEETIKAPTSYLS